MGEAGRVSRGAVPTAGGWAQLPTPLVLSPLQSRGLRQGGGCMSRARSRRVPRSPRAQSELSRE